MQITLYLKTVIRILVTHMNKFKSAAPTVTWHIPHQYSQEMEMKSETVSFTETVTILNIHSYTM